MALARESAPSHRSEVEAPVKRFGDSVRDGFWSAGGSEAGQADGVAVVDHCGGFLCGDVVECHFVLD